MAADEVNTDFLRMVVTSPRKAITDTYDKKTPYHWCIFKSELIHALYSGLMFYTYHIMYYPKDTNGV